MTRYGLGVFILRIVIPLMMTTSIITRPSFISLIYLAMMLYLPFINLLDERNIETGLFKYIMIFLPFQTLATQSGFYLYTISTDEIMLEENDHMRRLMKNVGLSSIEGLETFEVMCWLGPEVIMLLVSILYTWAVKMISSAVASEAMDKIELERVHREKFAYLAMSASTGKFITICILLISALWRHSVFGLAYFLIFLFFMSCWALCKDLRKLLSQLLFFCMPITIIHTVWQYCYQIEILQASIPKNNIYNRLFGIDMLIEAKPEHGINFTHYVFNTDNLINLSYPLIVYILYHFMVNEAVMLNSLDKFIKEEEKKGAPITISKKDRDEGRRRRRITTVTGGKNKIRRYIVDVLQTTGSVMFRHSYVGSIFIMMIWSVTFINVISFVQLSMSIVLWMVPQKKIVTVICCFLLCIFSYGNMAYTYMLDVDSGDHTDFGVANESTLSVLDFMELERRVTVEMVIKVFFTYVFWTTIRQYMEEKSKRIDLLRTRSEMIRSERKAGAVEAALWRFLVRWWIVLLAIFLFAQGITGQKMNLFRILNMFKYLLFMLILQLSFKAWRAFLYVYSIFLIFMSLFTMVTTYLYQFPVVDRFVEEVFHIPRSINADLGLVKIMSLRGYLNRVVLPAVYIVMNLIQMNFFHEPFMELTDEKNSEIAETEDRLREKSNKFTRLYMDVVDMIFLFLEFHMLKVVTLVVFLMCFFDPCALYFLILLPQCLTMVVPFKITRVFVMYWAAIVISVHNMLRMVYALRYIDESDYDVTCNMTKHPEINQTHSNFANWLGFKKYKESEKTLFSYLLWQTLFVAASSLNNIVFARQRIKRMQRGLPKRIPDVMFPEVTFQEADYSLKNFIKYILNYGYYRFGYEISLIMTAAVIAVRLDGYAIMYSAWLCLLLILKRGVVRWLWTLFVLFTSLSISWQYIMAIGLPPQWCHEYEWETRTHYWTVAQDFWFLADNYKPPPIKKLIAESLLLTFACRQLHNFWKEIRHARTPNFVYDGGSNKSILVHFEELGHQNPVSDFTTYTTSYLDMFKRIFFNASYYGAIWIVFLGGVNRNNVFSVVYLCYVFVYLWYGLNLYYKPLPLILRSWNNLIAQNVLIIMAKALLQVVGCFYLYKIPMSYCPLIKLLGIGCVRRFEDTDYFERLEQSSCNLKSNELAGIAWDVVIFAFLMLQRRVFMSYNFFLIIDEAKAGHLLSARGAVLLGEMKAKEIKAVNDENARIRDLIAKEQKKARATVEKYQGALSRNLNHPRATRVGDYFMFEEPQSQIEVDLLAPIDIDEGTEPDLTLTTLIVDWYETDMRQAVRKYWGKGRNDNSDENEPDTWQTRLLYLLKFCCAVLDSFIVDARELIDNHTGHYKIARDTLEKEKRLLKETTDYHNGVRLEGWWLPRASYDTLVQQSKLPEPKKPPKEITHEERPNVIKMVQSLWIITLAKSDLLCYYLIIMNQIMFCEVITLPLVILVFGWGTLSNPRPSKTYWIIMLGYVEWVILLKCIFQFEVMPGNVIREKVEFKSRLQKDNPFFPPLIFGLHSKEWYYIWEMFILFAIIIHRQYLKTIGLWSSIKDTSHQEDLDGLYNLSNGQLVSRRATTGATNKVYSVASSKANALDRGFMAIKTILIQYGINLRDFHQRLLLHVFQKPVDLYTPMFICDLASMFIIGIGYPAFFEFDEEDNDKTLFVYISQNIIPVKFVMMLFAHMIGSLVDRAIYLRKDVTAKLIVQLLNVIILHMFLFIFLPIWGNGRDANDDLAIILYYIFRCCYLLISACQIRCGYPSRIWGYCMTHNISAIRYGIFFGYMRIIPLLYEIRVLLDWMFTDTTMSIFEYFKMEDLYITLFDIKCKRQVEENHSVEPGEKKVDIFKYVYGSAWILLILVTVWFPIMYVAWGRTAGESNVPHHARLTLTIGHVDPVYDNVAEHIYQFSYMEYEYFLQVYNAYALSKGFLHGYAHSDVCALVFDPGSHIWMIREQDRQRIIKQLRGAHPVALSLQWEVGSKVEGQVHLAKGKLEKALYPFTSGRINLAKMMSFSDDPTLKPQTMRYMIPKYLKYSNDEVHIVDVLMKYDNYDDSALYRNITTGAFLSEADNRLWWQITETCTDPNYFEFLQTLPYDDCGHALIMYVFSDKLVPDLLGFSMASGGILGLYSIYFMLLNGFIRDFAIEGIDQAWFEENEMSNLRRWYNLTLMVYICREMENWEMEEWAYARLLVVCRSREAFQRLGLRQHWRNYEYYYVLFFSRLHKELMSLMMTQDKSISAFPEGENLFKWIGTIMGPKDTVYETLKFKLSLQFPNSYPYSAPLVKFLTPCFHPNVDTSGNICLDILKDKWSALYDVRTILLSIQALLGEPNIDSPLNALAAEKWQVQDEYKKYVLETYKEA
nr:unnamed protein product [Callosobruchus chinensis]